MDEKKVLLFEEIDECEMFAEYTDGCSGSRSDCCTRVCTRECNGDTDDGGDITEDDDTTEDAWGNFLEIESGVIQY